MAALEAFIVDSIAAAMAVGSPGAVDSCEGEAVEGLDDPVGSGDRASAGAS